MGSENDRRPEAGEVEKHLSRPRPVWKKTPLKRLAPCNRMIAWSENEYEEEKIQGKELCNYASLTPLHYCIHL
jgi:hypothetical protein